MIESLQIANITGIKNLCALAKNLHDKNFILCRNLGLMIESFKTANIVIIKAVFMSLFVRAKSFHDKNFICINLRLMIESLKIANIAGIKNFYAMDFGK